MRIDRRRIMLGGGVAGLGLGAAMPPLWARTGFDAWLDGFRNRARDAGLRRATLDKGLAGGVRYLPKVIELDQRQAEVAKPMQDYLASAASAGRISGGQRALRKWADTLRRIEKRTGVPPAEVVVAIWGGMESSFGGFRGSQPVISVLATLAFEGRRAGRFEDELIAALKILQKGHASPPGQMVGSHAGAMGGHTQFMPSTYLAHAVDGTGDGARDIWGGDDPRDALASTAAYLKALGGWRKGQPWGGVEVALPDGFDPGGLTGRVLKRSRKDWAGLGVRLPGGGGALPDHGKGGIILPAGPRGPPAS